MAVRDSHTGSAEPIPGEWEGSLIGIPSDPARVAEVLAVHFDRECLLMISGELSAMLSPAAEGDSDPIHCAACGLEIPPDQLGDDVPSEECPDGSYQLESGVVVRGDGDLLCGACGAEGDEEEAGAS